MYSLHERLKVSKNSFTAWPFAHAVSVQRMAVLGAFLLWPTAQNAKVSYQWNLSRIHTNTSNQKQKAVNCKPFFPLQQVVMTVGGRLAGRLSDISTRREDAAIFTPWRVTNRQGVSLEIYAASLQVIWVKLRWRSVPHEAPWHQKCH